MCRASLPTMGSTAQASAGPSVDVAKAEASETNAGPAMKESVRDRPVAMAMKVEEALVLELACGFLRKRGYHAACEAIGEQSGLALGGPDWKAPHGTGTAHAASADLMQVVARGRKRIRRDISSGNVPLPVATLVPLSATLGQAAAPVAATAVALPAPAAGNVRQHQQPPSMSAIGCGALCMCASAVHNDVAAGILANTMSPSVASHKAAGSSDPPQLLWMDTLTCRPAADTGGGGGGAVAGGTTVQNPTGAAYMCGTAAQVSRHALTAPTVEVYSSPGAPEVCACGPPGTVSSPVMVHGTGRPHAAAVLAPGTKHYVATPSSWPTNVRRAASSQGAGLMPSRTSTWQPHPPGSGLTGCSGVAAYFYGQSGASAYSPVGVASNDSYLDAHWSYLNSHLDKLAQGWVDESATVAVALDAADVRVGAGCLAPPTLGRGL